MYLELFQALSLEGPLTAGGLFGLTFFFMHQKIFFGEGHPFYAMLANGLDHQPLVIGAAMSVPDELEVTLATHYLLNAPCIT